MAEFDEVKTPDMNEPFDGPGVPPAVPQLFRALLGGLVVLAIPYVATPLLAEVTDDEELVKGLGEYRAWLPGDDIPFSKLFRVSRDKPVIAGLGGHGEIAGAETDTPAKVGVDGDPDIEDLGTPAVVVHTPEPVPTPEPKPGEDTKTAPTNAEKPAHPWAGIEINTATWEGLTTFIEDPHDVLAPAWDKMAKVLLKERGQVFRLSHFGDSAIAADGMPSSTRRYLHRLLGDAGHGYSLVAATNNWYKRKDVEWTSKGFSAEVFISDDAKDRSYGFGGTAAIGGPGARATWKTITPREGEDFDKVSGSRVSRFVVYHRASKNGGKVAVLVDGAEHSVVDTASETPEDRATNIEVTDGPHTLELKVVSGRVKLYGVALERHEGAIVDGLGIIGARDSRWLNVDPTHVEWAFGTRDPDLAAFMYGGNQLEDKVSMDAYKGKLTETVRLWKRGLGKRACLLVSPIDHGERRRGRVRTVERQIDIMKVQREVALAEGCAWFALYDAMGGDGSIGKWFEQGLAEGDLAHPTSKGALVLGKLFFMALMKGFHDHVEKVVKAHDEAAP